MGRLGVDIPAIDVLTESKLCRLLSGMDLYVLYTMVLLVSLLCTGFDVHVPIAK